MTGTLGLTLCYLVILLFSGGVHAQTIIQQSQDQIDSVKQLPAQLKRLDKSATQPAHPLRIEQLPSATSLNAPLQKKPEPNQPASAIPVNAGPIRPAGSDSASTRMQSSSNSNSESGPNEVRLWRLYDRREYAALEATIRSYRRRYPGWEPPVKLLRLSADGRKIRLLNRAYRGSSWNAIIAFKQRNPGYFDCDHINSIWMLAEAYARTQRATLAEQQYLYIIRHCNGDDIKIATMQKAQALLDGVALDSLWSSAQKKIDSTESINSLEVNRYVYDKNRFIRLYNADPKQIEPIDVQRLAVEVERHRDTAMANLMGWYYLNKGFDAEARAWFEKSGGWRPENEESAYGLALADKNLGNLQQAEGVARSIAKTSGRGQELLGEILLQRAWEKIDQQAYADARKLSTEVLAIGGDDIQARTVLAWTDYHQANFSEAAGAFESLYQQDRDADLARGWALSRAALNPDELPVLAETYKTDPLGREVNAVYAQQLYWRKHFLAAYDRSRESDQNLTNIDSPWLSAGALFRYKSGDKGMNRLDTAFIPIVQAAYFHQRVHRIGLTVDSMYLDSKTPPACAPIGSLPVRLSCSTRNVSVVHRPGRISVTSGRLLQQDLTTQLNGGESIELSYQRDGWFAPYVRLGTTPIGGVVSPRPTLQAGFLSEFGQGRWGAEVYSLPVRESILSYSGMRDPYSDRKWGRVLRSGAKGSLLFDLDNRWTLTGQLDVAALYGESVKTNWTGVASIGVGYDFKLSGFDYFSVGPEVSFQHFDQNQNHFTLGHGGYFSPDHFLTAGVGLHFLTREGRSFVLQGRIALGYQNFHDAAAPWFPLDSSVQNVAGVQVSLDGRPVFSGAPFYSGNSQDGIAHDFEFKGVWLAHPHLQIGGGIAARKTSGYDDYSSGLFVRFLFEPRRASFSSDIPRYLFQKFY